MLKEAGNFLAIFVFFFVLCVGYIYSQGGSPFALAGYSATLQGGNGSVVGPPTITAQKIDQVLCSAGSPACGTGQQMYDLGVQYRIDPIWCLAFFQHESSLGLKGEATITRNMGNLRSSSLEAFERDGYAVFYSWPEGYKAWYALISGPLYVGAGLTTPEQILQRYAPAGDNNDPDQYARAVEQDVQNWRAA